MSKHHIYKLKLTRTWRLYLCNCRMKKMNPAGVLRNGKHAIMMQTKKKRLYANNGGKCSECGQKIAWEDAQMHHILPFAEFPQYDLHPANLEMLCADCHHAIHLNPYENLRRMEQKAREFGFDLKEHYNNRKK